tara:strand:- start:28 stop:282 length:255 start_codon:yes stop_codon:yes gene_type:complete
LNNGSGSAALFSRVETTTRAGKIESMATKKSGRSKKKAETLFLVCQETGDYNYTIRRKPGGEKVSVKKYSPRLRKHTLHVEKKK